ncbi:MAG: hypothetical protein LBS96_02245 [Oscillospiraceae bacterium]|jgi:hypothetical protein|nr:hypothetical protein [Oscillospiraceae bacterium]
MKTDYKFDTMICNQADEDVFRRQCLALEKALPNLTKGQLLQDVDGSDFQEYAMNGYAILVESDTQVNGVFVRSDVDLRPYFPKKKPSATKQAVPAPARVSPVN